MTLLVGITTHLQSTLHLATLTVTTSTSIDAKWGTCLESMTGLYWNPQLPIPDVQSATLMRHCTSGDHTQVQWQKCSIVTIATTNGLMACIKDLVWVGLYSIVCSAGIFNGIVCQARLMYAAYN